jgi:hypothetical protein
VATTDYLIWYLSTIKVSSGVRQAIADELHRRGVEVPDAPPPRQPSCSRCGPDASVNYQWFLDALDREHIKARCGGCDAWLGFVPKTEPFLTLARKGR